MSEPTALARAPRFSVCVYCGSRPGVRGDYAQVARSVGRWIGRHGGQLVYGGGSNGLMGIVADAALVHGASVVGIIPEAMVQREWSKHDCTELHVVKTMHERKHMMAERADVFLALPGGIGTFEELFEMWAWRQLGFHDKPVGLLNVAGYYDPLLQMMQHTEREGFMTEAQRGLVHTGSDCDALLRELVQAAGFSTLTLGADAV